MKKILKAVAVGLLSSAGLLAIMWVLTFGLWYIMDLFVLLTGSIFIAVMSPWVILGATLIGVAYYMTHD